MGKLSNKKRFYLLFAALILLVWVAFKFAFTRTIDLHQQLKDLRQKVETTQDAPIRLRNMQTKLTELDHYIGQDNISSSLIETIGQLCQSNNLLLREIPEKHLFTDEHFQISTYQVTIEGNFKGLLSLLKDLEYNPKIGKLRGCSFETQQDFITGQIHLVGIYYLQSVSKLKQNDI